MCAFVSNILVVKFLLNYIEYDHQWIYVLCTYILVYPESQGNKGFMFGYRGESVESASTRHQVACITRHQVLDACCTLDARC